MMYPPYQFFFLKNKVVFACVCNKGNHTDDASFVAISQTNTLNPNKPNLCLMEDVFHVLLINLKIFGNYFAITWLVMTCLVKFCTT